MGTNYYRIPKTSETIERFQKLHASIAQLDPVSPIDSLNEFRVIKDPKDKRSTMSPWEVFVSGMSVHLGKRSAGWKFLWNWNSGKYYKTREQLLAYIRKGRIVDEYGQLLDTEEFIEMALNWNLSDGWDADAYLKEHPEHRSPWYSEKSEEYIDELRVSTSTDFS